MTPGTGGPAGRGATLALARVEAALLVRSPLVLAGLAIGAGLVWTVTDHVRPLWWDAGWRLGYGQMVLSTTVLVTAQLAVGRPWRDEVQDLYASLPTPAGTRVRAQLLATLGSVPASLLLLAAGTADFELRAAIGTPDGAVLAGGVLLVVSGAVVGVAVGARFPHPFAGILAGLVWFGAFSQTNRLNSGVVWLPPWSFAGGLVQLPAPLPGYPPAGGHDVELAGIAVSAAAVALVVVTGRPRIRRATLTGLAAMALVVTCLAGAAQVRPVATAALDRLAEDVATPAAVQRCASADGVRYCLYPGFGGLLPTERAPVSAVLAHLPARPTAPLTVRQVAEVTFDASLTYGHDRRQVDGWLARLRTAPAGIPAADAIYPSVGSWPAGARLADAQFALALAAAEWATGLPPSLGSDAGTGPPILPCVPVDQAREAVAVWLAVVATHHPIASLRSGLPGPGGRGAYALVGTGLVATWTYPGENAGYLAAVGPQPTADGFLLGQAMVGLPVRRVEDVLDRSWRRWLEPHTGEAALAAALDLPPPSFPVPAVLAAQPPAGPGQPVCRG